MKKLCLAYIPTRRPGSFPPLDAMKYAKLTKEKIQKLAPEIEVAGIEWLNDEGLLNSANDAMRVAEYMIAKGVDGVFLPHCNFGCEEAVSLVARKIAKPVLLWGPRDEMPLPSGDRLCDSQCGLFAASKVLHRFCVPFSYIVNSRLDDKVFEDGYVDFLRTMDAVRLFKNARIGQIGVRPKEFFSVIVNEGELLEQFGIEIIPTGLSRVMNATKKYIVAPTAAVKEEAEKIITKYNCSRVATDLPQKLAALKMAITDFYTSEGVTAIAFECWDMIQAELGICSCFVQSLLTGEGVPTVCETDIHGAITSLLMQGVSHFAEPTFLADLTIRHPENDNSELLWHCGVFPPQLADGACFIDKHFTLNHTEGICSCKLKPGHLTVSRFDGIRGKYSLFCGEGDTIEGPFNSGTYTYLQVSDWPKWERKLIYGPYIHHVAGAYGNYTNALRETTRFIDGLEFDPVD